jgi:hypothetical protein
VGDKLIVISERFPRVGTQYDVISGHFKWVPEFRSIPQKLTFSFFDGWWGSTNQILVFWGYFSEELKLQGTHLLLWNVDTDAIRLLAPNGIGGKFSPDGQTLAYLTFGPAQLDANAKPVEYMPDRAQQPYLQLMTMSSGQVVVSLPAVSSEDWNDSTGTHQHLQVEFSPDSRYLAFLTPGVVRTDDQGRPVSVAEEYGKVYLNLLDVQSRQLLWSALAGEETMLSWSPTGQYLVFRDPDQNLQLLDASALAVTAITLENGELATDPAWSFDGRYLSLLAHYSDNTLDYTAIFDLGAR